MLIELNLQEQILVDEIVEQISYSKDLKKVMQAWNTACNTNQRVAVSVHRRVKNILSDIVLCKDPRFTKKDLYDYIEYNRITHSKPVTTPLTYSHEY